MKVCLYRVIEANGSSGFSIRLYVLPALRIKEDGLVVIRV